MYREIKAAGNVQKLIDLAMMQSEERAAKGGRFEDVGTRSDPRASSPTGMSVFRAHKERSERENVALRAADERDTKGYFDTDARGGYLDRRKAPRPMPPPRVETKGRDAFAATRRRTRDAFGRFPRLRRPRLKPRKSSRWNARSRRSTRKRTSRLKTRTDAGMADGGNTNRRWEGTRAEDGGDGNVETEAFSDGDVETECCGYDWRFARYVSLITRARSLHRLGSRSPHVSSRVLARVHAASRGDIRDASVLVPRRRLHPRGRRHRSPSELAARSVRPSVP